jgi:hypothetical protein
MPGSLLAAVLICAQRQVFAVYVSGAVVMHLTLSARPRAHARAPALTRARARAAAGLSVVTLASLNAVCTPPPAKWTAPPLLPLLCSPTSVVAVAYTVRERDQIQMLPDA